MSMLHSIAKRRLIHGFGVNDSNYVTNRCPFYACWTRMINRCYSEKIKARQPTYVGCYVCVEWHSFMVFREWMQLQDWDGKQLDKDLIGGGKLYSPENCVFLSSKLNSLFLGSDASRGEHPIGVSWNKKNAKYIATISVNGKCKQLGYFTNSSDAHEAWLKAKLEIAQNYLANEKNTRVRYAIQCGISKLQTKN